MGLGPCVPHIRTQFPSGPEPWLGLVTLGCWRSESHPVARSMVLRCSWVPGWDSVLLPCAEKHCRYFLPTSISLQHKSQFGTACIAKSTRLVTLTLSGERGNLMHSRDMPRTAFSTDSGHLSRGASQHLTAAPPKKKNELLNFGPWMSGWGRVGNGPVASCCTLAAEFTSQTQGALSE